jgi:hypothetical protein
MIKFLLICLFSLLISNSYSQSAMASVNGSTGIKTAVVHALDDAVITLEVYPNSEDWEWMGPEGYMDQGAGVILSGFSADKEGTYMARHLTDPNIADVEFELIFLEDDFAGTDMSMMACHGENVILETEVDGLIYNWSTNEMSSSIEVVDSIDRTYDLTISTLFGDSDSVSFEVSRIAKPSLSATWTHAISCAQEGQLTLTLQDFNLEDLPILASIYKDDQVFQNVFFRDTIITVGIPAGNYDAIKIESYNDCTFSYDGFSINKFTGIREEFNSATLVLCQGDEYTLNALGGYAEYLWDNGSVGGSIDISPVVSQTYSVVMLDDNSCGITVNYPVVVAELPSAIFDFENDPAASGGTLNLELFSTNTALFPVKVYATSNGVEQLLATTDEYITAISVSENYYEDLRIESVYGCETNLGNFGFQVNENITGNRIVGKVWLDVANNMGVLEEIEEGIEGIVVRAINLEGDVKAQTVSDIDGTYSLEVNTETVYLEFDPVYNLTGTVPNLGTDDDIDSDMDGSNGPRTTEFINTGETTTEVNAGFVFGVLSLSWNGISVKQEADSHMISWDVYGEEFLSHYELERSIGGIDNFQVIATVDPLDSNGESNTYNYRSNELTDLGHYYYRVKHLELDGRFTYSDIVAVEVTNVNTTTDINFNVFPVPANDVINIEIDNIDNQEIGATIYSIDGKLISSDIIRNDVGNNEIIKIDISSLSSNIYILQLTIGNQLITKSIAVE